jgi:retron-type reverse transcriptase
MGSLWDKVKGLFASPTPTNDPIQALIPRVAPIVVDFAQRQKRFTSLEVADELTKNDPGRTTNQLREASQAVTRLCTEDFLRQINYASTTSAHLTVFHPMGQGAPAAPTNPVPSWASPKGAQPAQPSPPQSPPPTFAQQPKPGPFPVPQPVPMPAPKAAKPAPAALPNPYKNEAILGLSQAEMRARAMRINPYQTAWIGRVDTIPPQTDERTALIDRGLILRGLLTEQQITEIHQVGDLWIRFHDAAGNANMLAAKSAQEAVQVLQKRKADLKAKKQAESAAKKKKHIADVVRRKREDIIYLGPGVSGRLQDRLSNLELLQAKGLPVLSTPADVAVALGLEVGHLRWLCFHSEAVEKPHYVHFYIPKRSGGQRLISAPHQKLAAAQLWVLKNILEKLSIETEAHGFIPGRSTLTNARPHLKSDVVVNLDLSDFFPSITFPRVRGLFEKLGYSPAVATVLTLLCTEPVRRQVEYENRPLWVAVGPRALPQGACTSPALSNQIARKLDRRLQGTCAKRGWVYTRYADDLTFSAPTGHREEIGRLLARVRHLVQEEGFALNPKKGRVQRKGGRQIVTGIVVNQKPGLPREEVRRLRALLHLAQKTGLEAQNRESRPHFQSYLQGKIAYLHMIDPAKAEKLRAMLGKCPA